MEGFGLGFQVQGPMEGSDLGFRVQGLGFFVGSRK